MRGNYFLIIFLFCFLNIFSKNLIFTLIDNTKIKIGQPISYSLHLHKKYYTPFILNKIQNKLKTSNIEFQLYTIDSKRSKNYIYYNLILTSFIPGRQVIPSFDFIINNKLLKTSSYFITVLETQIDFNKPYRDIKNIENINFIFLYELLYYFFRYINYILLILVCIIFYCIYNKIFNKKNNKHSYNLASFNETIYKINQLKSKNYIEKLQFRLFYIEFSDLIREHFSFYYQIPAKMLFTEDLLYFIKLNNLVPELYYQLLLDILKISDAVKFAKFIPNHNLCVQQLEQFIDFVNKSNKGNANK